MNNTTNKNSMVNKSITDCLADLLNSSYSLTGLISNCLDNPLFFLCYILFSCVIYLVFGPSFGNPLLYLGTITMLTRYFISRMMPAIDSAIGIMGKELPKAMERVSAQVGENVEAAMRPLLDAIPNTIEVSADRLRKGIHGLATTDNKLSLHHIIAEAMSHKLGVTAVARDLLNANTKEEIASEMVKLASLAGLEAGVVDLIVNKLINVADQVANAPEPVTEESLDDIREMLGKNTWTMKRTVGLAGLAAALTGYDVEHAPLLTKLVGAQAKAKAIETVFDSCEEYLNQLGIIDTGKWAYLKEIGENLKAFEEEAVTLGKLVSTRTAIFIRQTYWKRFQLFRTNLLDLSNRLNRNTCPDVRSSKASMACQALLTRVEQWAVMINQIRATNGRRCKPLGVSFFSKESQIGKSEASAAYSSMMKKRLAEIYTSNPEAHPTLEDAGQWTTWNMSIRDEFDQNYAGDEIVYADDAFAGVKCEDHQQWLTWISNEVIGTKQADLVHKGMAFNGRICITSSNTLPTTSVSINNIHALHQRFPLCAYVTKLHEPPTDYDPKFSHLTFHVGPMHQHCWTKHPGNGCTPGHVRTDCQCRDMTLEQMVELGADWIIREESYFLSSMASIVNPDVVEAESEDLIDLDDETEPDQVYVDAQGDPMPEDRGPFNYMALRSDMRIHRRNLEGYRNHVEFVNEPNYELSTPLNRFEPPAALEPHGSHARVGPYTAGWQSTGNTNALRQHIRLAYRHAPLVDPGDVRIMTWARYLRHKTTLSLLTADISNGSFSNAYELFSALTTYEMIPDQDEHFCRTFRNFTRLPWRVHDTNLDTCYLWSFKLNGGSQLIVTPFVEERDLDESYTCRELDLFIGGLQDFDISERTINDSFNEWRFQTRNVFSEYREMTFMRYWMYHASHNPRIGAWFFYTHGSYTLPPVTFGACTFFRGLKIVNTRFLTLNDVCNVTLDAIFTLPSIMVECVEWFRSFSRLIADSVHFCILKLMNMLGLEVGQFVYDFTEVLSRFSVHTVQIITVFVAASGAYCLYKLLTSGNEKVQSQAGYSGKETLRREHRMKARKVAAQSVGPAVNPQTVDYFLEDHECPFCRNDWGQGEDRQGTDYQSCRLNKWQPPNCEESFVLPVKEHSDFIKSKEEFETILKSTMDIWDEVGDDNSQIHMEHGALAAGSVPHLHTKIYNFKDRSAFFGPIQGQVKFGTFMTFMEESVRYCRVSFRGNDSDDLVKEIIKNFYPLIELAQHFSLRVEFETPEVYTAYLTLTGTKISSGDSTLVKRNIKELRRQWETITGYVAGNAPSDVIVPGSYPQYTAEEPSRKEPVVAHSLDDVALDTLRRLTTSLQVLIFRPYGTHLSEAQRYKDFGLFNKVGSRTAGLGYLNGAFCPAHVTGGMHSFVRVYPLGAKVMLEYNFQREQYSIGLVTAYNIDADIAYVTFVTKAQFESTIYKRTGECPNADNALDKPVPYSNALINHAVRDVDIENISTVRMPAAQWLPTSGAIATCTLKMIGDIPLIYTVNGEDQTFIRTHIVEAVRVQGGSIVSRVGDCGGVYMMLNPRATRKLLGFHIAANNQFTYAALLTAERILDFTAKVVQLEALDETVPASTLHECFPGIPRIFWDAEDPWVQLIGSGQPVDMPVGEESRYVGSVSKTCLPTSQIKSGNFLGDWRLSPFADAFEEVLAPGVLSPRDPRLAIELPTNLVGEPSLTLKQDFLFAQALPKPNAAIMSRVLSAMTQHYSLLLADRQIGNQLNPKESISLGLNGRWGNQFITGIDCSKSSGYPWSVMDGYGKKSDFIDVDMATGKRSLNYRGYKYLEPRLLYSLEQAMSNKRVIEFCAIKLKDTCVKLKHIRNGKTRTFNSTSVERLVLSNIVNGNMREAYTQLFLAGDHFIGGDPHSIAWDELYAHLIIHPNWIFIDYENFDRRQSREFSVLAEKVWNDTIMNVDPDSYDVARWVESANAIESLMVSRTTIWQTGHGNKSGDPKTTPRNNLVNQANMFYVWLTMHPTSNWAEFRDNVQMVFFGDDAVMTVSDRFKSSFNYNTIATVLKTVGHIVTPGNKVEGDVQPDFADMNEVTFLKRYFRVRDGIHIAPLEKSSIESPFVWTKNEDGDYQIWCQLIGNALIEACLWGKDYFDFFHSQIVKVMSKDEFPAHLRETVSPYLCTSYEEVWASFVQKRHFQ